MNDDEVSKVRRSPSSRLETHLPTSKSSTRSGLGARLRTKLTSSGRALRPVLKAFGAHIFFDDQEKHVVGASSVVPAGLVPGPHFSDQPVIPAG